MGKLLWHSPLCSFYEDGELVRYEDDRLPNPGWGVLSMHIVHFSSDRIDWASLPEFVKWYADIFGEFDIDVCANGKNHRCPVYFSPTMDGLRQSWKGNCWMKTRHTAIISCTGCKKRRTRSLSGMQIRWWHWSQAARVRNGGTDI